VARVAADALIEREPGRSVSNTMGAGDRSEAFDPRGAAAVGCVGAEGGVSWVLVRVVASTAPRLPTTDVRIVEDRLVEALIEVRLEARAQREQAEGR
jgi:hypothetical protein